MPNVAERCLREAAAAELRSIADWWLVHTVDTKLGGFLGEIDYHGNPVADANKGCVLNARILWFFSEAALFDPQQNYRDAAERAFQYLVDYFDDRDYGGVYWALDSHGAVVDDKKQIYALCFCIYALAAYYRLTSNPLALEKALQYFGLVELHAKDIVRGGYTEAFSRDWRALDDVRLSVKDLNAPKTMNTHLHLLEAYTGLHVAAPSPQTATALRNSIEVFCERFVDIENGHLKLFFDRDWHGVSTTISYGHDIEASWLLWEAGEALGDSGVMRTLRPVVLRLADVCLRESFGEHRQVCSEFDREKEHRENDGIWWVQTEALVGFMNAYQISGDIRYLAACHDVWQFIREYHVDMAGGEWHWLSGIHGNEQGRNYKAGFWKGPYHNGRAMMETCKRLDSLLI